MARRGGKAANRNARRKAQRAGRQRPAPSTRPTIEGQVEAPSAPSASLAQPDAFEIADAEVRAAAAPPMSSTPIRGRGRPADPRVTLGGTSRLTEKAVAEYHYVQRDLRNIGVLVVVMAVLLVLATLAVNALGIGRAS
jgi:hypothetical protein